MLNQIHVILNPPSVNRKPNNSGVIRPKRQGLGLNMSIVHLYHNLNVLLNNAAICLISCTKTLLIQLTNAYLCR